MQKSAASEHNETSAMEHAPKNGVYILVFDNIKGWVMAKWVEHAQMFSNKEPQYQCRFYPVKNPVAWQHLPRRPDGWSCIAKAKIAFEARKLFSLRILLDIMLKK